MTREEYLKQLKNNLPSLTNDEIQEALQYYSDYFEEAGDDEKVMNELGTPEELAKVIIEKCSNALAKTKVSDESKNEYEEQDNSAVYDAMYYEFDPKKVKSLFMHFSAAEIVVISGNKYSVETRGISKNFISCHLNSEGVLTINNFKKLNIKLGEYANVCIYNGDKKVCDLNMLYGRSFADVSVGSPILYMNSVNHMAVAINQGNFADAYRIGVGSAWLISFTKR